MLRSSASGTSGILALAAALSLSFTASESAAQIPPGPGDITNVPIIDRELSPCDRPSLGQYTLVECLGDRGPVANEAIDIAGYMVWRARQVLDAVLSAPSEKQAQERWEAYFTGHVEFGASLQTWFGDYSHARTAQIKGALDDIWNKYLGPGASGWEVHCHCNAVQDAASSAHHLFEGAPRLCSGFFGADRSPEERGALIVHELLHHTKIEGTLIKDTHPGFGCPLNDGLQKCYSQEDALTLAELAPDEAKLNNSNYEYFVWFWAARYWLAQCNNYSVCSGRDLLHPDCQPPVEDLPGYSGCDMSDPASLGTPGCPCVDVAINKPEDAAYDGGFPDGEGSYLAAAAAGTNGPGQFCHGADVVCDSFEYNGRSYPVCKSCNDGVGLAGCPCESDKDCGEYEGLSCWGSAAQGFAPVGTGTCLPDGNSPDSRERMTEMPWFCLDNCAAIDPYPQGGLSACAYDQVPGFDFDHGTCVSFLASCVDGIGGLCESQGKRCINQPDNSIECQAECDTDADCELHGFSGDYTCDKTFKDGVPVAYCVPGWCADISSPYCELFR